MTPARAREILQFINNLRFGWQSSREKIRGCMTTEEYQEICDTMTSTFAGRLATIANDGNAPLLRYGLLESLWENGDAVLVEKHIYHRTYLYRGVKYMCHRSSRDPWKTYKAVVES